MGSRGMALAIGLALATATAPAAESPSLPQGGLSAALIDIAGTDRDTRRRAAEAVPLERMPEPQRRLAAHSLRAATLFHHLPTEVVTCGPEFLEFVLEKPEVMVDLWRTLGISRLALDPAAPGQWRLADGYGTEGLVQLLHRERTEHGGLLVFHGRGGYAGPLAPRQLSGSCLVLIRHRPVDPDGLGRPRQAVQVDAFLDVDGIGLEIVTRTLKPLIVRSAAGNFHEICLFVSQFSAAATRNPVGVARLTARMSRTSPSDRRAFAGLASGAGRSRSTPDATAEEMQAELAARWLPADRLEPPRR